MVHDEEIVAAKNTFGGFVTLMTWGTVGAVIAAALVILIIR